MHLKGNQGYAEDFVNADADANADTNNNNNNSNNTLHLHSTKSGTFVQLL